ncbi:MAG: DUF1330 domain-containing protein [Woeseia sp.]|jgi:uncharacterized protein (DUF1330 family)|nr:DUF1330 domain-containing protein [Woeseia sp.]MBT6210339.1 DUF1330 domain-containing protein [Woeseia sp.]
MPAYVVSMMSISDADTYRKYTDRTPPIVKRHGGKFLARGGDILTVEGEEYNDRMVILEFPSRQAILDWYADPEYEDARVFRHASSDARILVIDGNDNTQDPDPKL